MFLSHWLSSGKTIKTHPCDYEYGRRKCRRRRQAQYVFGFVRFGGPLTLLSADENNIEGDAGIPKVASKPKPRAVLKGKGTHKDLGAGGKELDYADPFGMSYAK